jgi:hypothetical protein
MVIKTLAQNGCITYWRCQMNDDDELLIGTVSIKEDPIGIDEYGLVSDVIIDVNATLKPKVEYININLTVKSDQSE